MWGRRVLGPRVPLDRQSSALQQIPQVIATASTGAWSDPLAGFPARSHEARDLATLLLAVNYELLGYPPAQAWMFAQRGEAAAPGPLDG